MQLGSCYKNSNGAKSFAAKLLANPSSYDPKDIRYSRWRLTYAGHNRTHVWLRMSCAESGDRCDAANIAPFCTSGARTQCTDLEKNFFPQNVYFYGGSELNTTTYPSKLSMRITDKAGEEQYNSELQRRIYPQGRSPRLAVYKNERTRLTRAHLAPGSLVHISHPLGTGLLSLLENDAHQMLYSFMTPNFDGMTHFWCPVWDVYRE